MSVGQTGGSERGSWSALLDEATAEEVENLDFFDDIGARIAGARAPDTGGANLGAPGRAIAAVTILAGRSRASPLLEQVAPLLPAVIQELMPLPGKPRRLDAFWTLSYLNAARCAASVVPDSATTAENAWLPELATMREHFSDPERHTLALAACACAQVALVPAMLGVRSLPVFAPGETFGFNVQGFTPWELAAFFSIRLDLCDSGRHGKDRRPERLGDPRAVPSA